MSQSSLPPSPGSIGLLTLADSLGIDANALVNAMENAGSTTCLHHLSEAETAIERLRLYTVTQLRRNGRTWDQIAYDLGTTKQAAHKKFRHVDPSKR